MQRKLSIVLTVVSSNHFLPSTIKSISSELTACKADWEIIVIGQTDPQVQEYIDRKLYLANKVKFFDYPANLPPAKAFSYGFYKTSGNLICYLTNGLDMPALNIRTLLAHFDQDSADIVIGSRLNPQSQLFYPFSLRLLSYAYLFFNRLIFNLDFNDSRVNVKIFKRSILETIIPKLSDKQLAFDLEILVLAQQFGPSRICNAPIVAHQSKVSSVKLAQIGQFAKEIVSIFFNLSILKTYNRPPTTDRLLIHSRQLTV